MTQLTPQQKRERDELLARRLESINVARRSDWQLGPIVLIRIVDNIAVVLPVHSRAAKQVH